MGCLTARQSKMAAPCSARDAKVTDLRQKQPTGVGEPVATRGAIASSSWPSLVQIQGPFKHFRFISDLARKHTADHSIQGWTFRGSFPCVVFRGRTGHAEKVQRQTFWDNVCVCKQRSTTKKQTDQAPTYTWHRGTVYWNARYVLWCGWTSDAVKNLLWTVTSAPSRNWRSFVCLPDTFSVQFLLQSSSLDIEKHCPEQPTTRKLDKVYFPSLKRKMLCCGPTSTMRKKLRRTQEYLPAKEPPLENHDLCWNRKISFEKFLFCVWNSFTNFV